MKSFVIYVVGGDDCVKSDWNEAALRPAVNRNSICILQVEEVTPEQAAQMAHVPVPESWGTWLYRKLGYYTTTATIPIPRK